MNRTEAPSAQCRSSTTSSCGRPAASAATSQYRPWRTPNDGSASPGGAAPSGNTIGAASAAAPANAGRAPRPTCRAAAAPAAAAPPPTRTRAPTRTREPPQRRVSAPAPRRGPTPGDSSCRCPPDPPRRPRVPRPRPPRRAHPRSRPGRALARGVGRSCPDASLWPPTPEAPDAPCRTSRPAKAHARGGASSRTSPIWMLPHPLSWTKQVPAHRRPDTIASAARRWGTRPRTARRPRCLRGVAVAEGAAAVAGADHLVAVAEYHRGS